MHIIDTNLKKLVIIVIGKAKLSQDKLIELQKYIIEENRTEIEKILNIV